MSCAGRSIHIGLPYRVRCYWDHSACRRWVLAGIAVWWSRRPVCDHRCRGSTSVRWSSWIGSYWAVSVAVCRGRRRQYRWRSGGTRRPSTSAWRCRRPWAATTRDCRGRRRTGSALWGARTMSSRPIAPATAGMDRGVGGGDSGVPPTAWRGSNCVPASSTTSWWRHSVTSRAPTGRGSRRRTAVQSASLYGLHQTTDPLSATTYPTVYIRRLSRNG